jgi:tetratricopeptide (TPR) repeat protein
MKTTNYPGLLKRQLCTLGCFISMFTAVYSQTVDLKYEKGLACRKERDYVKGLSLFKMLVRSDSANLDYLIQASYFYGRYGFFHASEAEKRTYYLTARRLAEKAIAIDHRQSEAHYTFAMSLAYLAQVSDLKFRLTVGRTIKKEAELAVMHDPGNAAALHMLGRWHLVVAGFEGLQRAAINCVAPDLIKAASFSDAQKYLLKAHMMEPHYKPHMVALAETYHEMGLDETAKSWLGRAASIGSCTVEDRLADEQCARLAAKLRYDMRSHAPISLTRN